MDQQLRKGERRVREEARRETDEGGRGEEATLDGLLSKGEE